MSLPPVPDSAELLANVIDYLHQGQDERDVQLLLTCSLQVELEPNGSGVVFLKLTFTALRQTYEDLRYRTHNEDDPIYEAFGTILEDVYRFAEGESHFSDRYSRHYFEVKFGVPDAVQQAHVAQLLSTKQAAASVPGGVHVTWNEKPLFIRPISFLSQGPFRRSDQLCFVMMPFAPQFQATYDQAIRPAVLAAQLHCQRGDDIAKPGAVLGQIWSAIVEARVIIADLSNANGNVLYELGLAHAIGQDAILLTQNVADVPFDLRHMRLIVYDSQPSGLQKLQLNLQLALRDVLSVA